MLSNALQLVSTRRPNGSPALSLLALLSVGLGAGPARAQGFQPDTLRPAAATVVGDAALTEFQRQPALLPLAPVVRYARTQVGYERSRGEFRRAQAAERAQGVLAATEGYRDWKGFRLLGRFRYERQWLDSVRLSLLPTAASERPYYPLAQQPGNWDNQAYQLGGTLARQWGRLLVGAQADLNLGDYARSNDPRPKIARHGLQVSGSVGYQLRPAWTLAAQYGYGYGQESLVVQFVNDANQDGSNTPYTLYRLLGYGYLSEQNASKTRQTAYQQQHLGRLSLVHTMATATYLLTAEADRQVEDVYSGSPDVVDDQIARDDIGRYTLNGQRLYATRLSQQAGGSAWYQRLTLAREAGRDELRVLVKGNNYLYTQQLAQVAVGRQRASATGTFTEVEATLGYRAERRVDGTAQHRRQTRRADVRGHWQQRRPLGSSTWQALYGLGATLELDAGSSLRIPTTQQNFFSRGVAIPDYYYDRQTTLAPTLRLGAEQALSPRTRLRAALDAAYLTPLGRRSTNLPATFTPNGHRWAGQLVVTLFH